MQTSTQLSHCGTATLDVPSITRAARLRIVAENNLQREVRHQNVNLRRLLTHIAVLESVDVLQTENPPPSYTTAVSRSASASSCTALTNTDELPVLEESKSISDDSESDGSGDDEWSDDDNIVYNQECDAEHALLRIPSHPPIFNQPRGHCTWTCTGDHALDPFHWAELASEIAPKAGGYPAMKTRIVEVSEVED